MILALVLHFAGVDQVLFDDKYYRFMNMVNERLGDWRIEIPLLQIIEIPKSGNDWLDIGINIGMAIPNTLGYAC